MLPQTARNRKRREHVGGMVDVLHAACMAIATPKTETPVAAPAVTPAPVVEGPAVTAPAVDWQAKATEAEKAASKMAKQLKDLEAKSSSSEAMLSKLSALFGPQSTDPVAEATAARDQAARFQQLASRSIAEAAIVRQASVAGLHDPDDAVRLLGGTVEVDLSTGSIKEPEQVSRAISALKMSKPYLFKSEAPTPAATTLAPVVVKAPTPTSPAPAPTENKPKGSTWGGIFNRVPATVK